MANANWTLKGQYMESCNCDYLCPCIYTNPQNPVTHDHCYAMLVYRVDQGRFEDTPLDGRKFALIIRSGKIMSDGGWVLGCIVDADSDEEQRSALGTIVSGRAGGTPGMIHENLVSDFRGVDFKPIEFIMDGLIRRANIPDVLSFEIEGVASRNKSGEPYYIDNTAHPSNRRLALARTKQSSLGAFNLQQDMIGKGNNGHYAPFHWTS